MRLEDLQIYQMSMDLSERVWIVVQEWSWFSRDTLGKQLVRAADSISANIAEGFGRYHFKENLNFCFYSRGSLYETKTWLTKAHNRNLINKQNFEYLINLCNTLALKLNNYIKTIGKATSPGSH
ncbi:four helix bundle protein [Dyadobacter sandarakinus]|uniref:Four helix bundle protein n=1 Tax=Dyadobacter sandarakinus TaxID=2747268 RepID=A0ABX7IA32_9BACT|nr:four helix bundle protein [Dyadobacter sandarakinus]QRR02650.1 four helix bundle protein [Dyadobacter sandarakinus]